MDYIEYVEEDEEMVEKGRIIVDGKECEVDMIRKDGTIYVKTRDIGKLLNLKVSSKGSIPTFDNR